VARAATQTSTRNSRRAGAAGFTLLEILLVVAIAALVVGVVVPQLTNLGGLELKQAARRLAGAARYAGDQAAVRKATHRIVFDLEARRYQVQYLDQDTWRPDPATLGGLVQLPPEVRVVSVETRARGRKAAAADGEAFVVFYPKGYAERATIQLGRGETSVYTVEVRAFDPRPRVHAGPLALEDADALALVPSQK
jgi:type II secretion system protein H